MNTDRTTTGPAADFGPPRRTMPRLPRWLAVPFLVRLAVAQLRRRPVPSIAAAAAGAVGGGVLTRVSDGSVAWAAILLVATSAAALASATDPAERERARLIIEQGCPRTVVRLAQWLSALLPPAAAGTLAAVFVGLVPGAPEHPGAGVALVVVSAAVGAWSTAGTVLTELLFPRRQRRAALAGRVGGGVGLAALAIWFVATSTSSGSNVDLALPVSLACVFGAFALVAPAAIGATTALVERVPGPTARLGASSTARNRRGLTLPVTLLAGITCLLVVMVAVGEGLGTREAARRQAVTALGPATIAGSNRLVVVQSSAFLTPDSATGDLVTRLRAAVPTATVADVQSVPLEPRSGRDVLGEVRTDSFFTRDASPTDVAVATPELLEVLGLDPGLARSDRAVVLDARVLRPDRTVRLTPFPGSAPSPVPAADRPTTVAAVLAHRNGVLAGLPAVLLPPSTMPPLVAPPSGGSLAIVGFAARPPTDAELAAIQTTTTLPIKRGDDTVDVLGLHRTDRLDSISVRDRADSYRLLGGLVVVAIAAGGLAQLAIRLATRREDATLLDLGAGRWTLVRVATVRAVVVAVVGVGLGAAIGLSGTAIGLARYRRVGRFAGSDPLAPIPFIIPAPVWVGVLGILTAVVLAGATVATLAPAKPTPPGRPSWLGGDR